MGGGAPPDAMAACAHAASRIVRDILACLSRDGRILDAHRLRDSVTLPGRWSSADCACVRRRRALLVAREAAPGRVVAACWPAVVERCCGAGCGMLRRRCTAAASIVRRWLGAERRCWCGRASRLARRHARLPCEFFVRRSPPAAATPAMLRRFRDG
ncbi:hypothetical protein F511_43659 [Dorcoceras hygrometricum]|uniref:Uncharacterized protein n=1 Tax=Dorcoceras hygrometricum TaxID=472368 RepID=A0A2Z7BZG1_9LAMI|nr:hypothetical protein F511_43659 [Dorcoceras hygrometricum]